MLPGETGRTLSLSLCGAGRRTLVLGPGADLGCTVSLNCLLITKPTYLDMKKVLFRDGALVTVWPGSESQGRGFPGFFPWPS